MAFPLTDLTSEITNLTKSSKRPEREIRNFIRELTDCAFTGTLTVESVTKTIAYTKRKDLRDGNTIKAIIPKTECTIALQVSSDMPVEPESDVTCTFRIDKFDGYTHTIHAYQLESEAPEGALKRTAGKEASDAAGKNVEADLNNPNADPLEKFQTEALAALSRDDTNVNSDTSREEDLLAQLQLEAEQQLKQLTEDVSENIRENTDEPVTIDESPPTELQADAASNNLEYPPLDAEEIESKQQSEATSNQADKVSPTGNANNSESLTASINENTTKESSQSGNHGPVNAANNGDLSEQVDSPQTIDARANTGSEPTPDAADNREEAGLEELTKEALGNSDSPITLDLLSRIVALQTGVPTKTVSAIQKAMWTQISNPTTFGDGQSMYRFPLLGKFTVRKNLDEMSLDFVSSNINEIADADIDDSITFDEAQQLVQADSGPLIARHVVPLALNTAGSLGMQQAQTYLTIYRTILLFLRIMAKGERRIRIDEVGEFFPSIFSGNKAYRFRAYPALLRATSSAFKDSIVFLSTTGEAQDKFDSISHARKVQEPLETQDSGRSLKGCLTVIAIIIGAFVLASMS